MSVQCSFSGQRHKKRASGPRVFARVNEGLEGVRGVLIAPERSRTYRRSRLKTASKTGAKLGVFWGPQTPAARNGREGTSQAAGSSPVCTRAKFNRVPKRAAAALNRQGSFGPAQTARDARRQR